MNAKHATLRQLRIRSAIELGGYTIKREEMIGKKLWISAERLYVTDKHPNGNVFLDETLLGTIGPRGALSLEYAQFTYRTKITGSARGFGSPSAPGPSCSP